MKIAKIEYLLQLFSKGMNMKLIAIVVAAIALTLSYSASGKVKCGESNDMEEVCAKGKRPDPNHQPYEFCMIQHNDHDYCTGNSQGGSGGESSTGPSNGSSYGPVEPKEGDWCQIGGDNGRMMKNAWDGGLTCETNLTGSCTTSGGTAGRWEGSNSAGFHCEQIVDSDGDEIPDHLDDCPNDPTNSDPFCLDDLTDCPTLISTVVGALTTQGLINLALKGASTVIVLRIATSAGLLVVTTTVGTVVKAGMAAITFGTLYCAAAALEG